MVIALLRPSRAQPTEPEIFGLVSPNDAVARAAEVDTVHEHCAVYTEPRVAEAILDRIGWVDGADLRERRLLEPSCGDGAFLFPAVRRLLASARRLRTCNEKGLLGSIVAFEFDPATATAARAKLRTMLVDTGFERAAAKRIAASWIRCEDFLLAEGLPGFTDVVGNPPYMRWSKVPANLKALYEARLPRHAARGDLCLAFVCRSVDLLEPAEGRVAFLCADRWLRCAYGTEARSALVGVIHLALHLEVHDVPVFVGTRKVGAYAAITILERGRSGEVVVASATSMNDLCEKLMPKSARASVRGTSRMTGKGGAVLVGQKLASTFEMIVASGHLLREAEVSVRCGMALGRATTYVIDNTENTRVEDDRLVPWIRTRDLGDDGTVSPSARFIDVWDQNGKLVPLRSYPMLKAHLARDREGLAQRVCVRDAKKEWYRTIDKSNHERLMAPKILVAGMSRFARVALSTGGSQPSNAIYSITSTQWPLASLFALFRCGLLDLFASVLSPRFSGDVKRFDGNLLRQVRVPPWPKVEESLRTRLRDLDASVALPRPDLLVELFGLSDPVHFDVISKAIERS